MLIAAAHLVIEVHLLDSDHRWQDFCRTRLPFQQSALLGELLLPFTVAVVMRVIEGHPRNIFFGFDISRM
jgi:hypothetical protein